MLAKAKLSKNAIATEVSSTSTENQNDKNEPRRRQKEINPLKSDKTLPDKDII